MAENHALIPEPITMYTQTDVKEVKDLSQNLVSGDFERQYTDRMAEKTRRRRYPFIILGVCIGALAVCMVVVTFVRELQIARLRHELDELSANMIAISANVKSLNQKLANNRFFNEFRTLEDTMIYADEDENPNMTEDKQTGWSSDSSLEKLHDLTVLEDDSDDEDAYDDDDAESGDWYRDYDTRRQKVGTTNMVHLKPEEFTDMVLTFEKEKQNPSHIRELKKLLNENPENPNLGFPSKSTADSTETSRQKRSMFPDSTPELLDTVPPRNFAKPEERRKTKKYIPSSPASTTTTMPTQPAKVALHTVTRRSDDEGMQRRPFVAAHFHGNTSHLNPDTHPHYKGNGLIRVPHNSPHEVWYPSPWTMASPNRPTLSRNSHIHVHHTGVYLVYVQIYYLDSHDLVSWVLHRTNRDIEGHETLLQCTQSSHSTEPLDKPNTCFSAAALFLKDGDRLVVKNTGGGRHSLMEPEKSFIGLIKLADVDDPEVEL